MIDKQIILDIYCLAIKDEWLSKQEIANFVKLCFNHGIDEEELVSVVDSSGRNPHLPDQLWLKEKYLLSLAYLIVSSREITRSNYSLYLHLHDRLNAESINKREIFDSAIDNYIKAEELKLKRLKGKFHKSCDKLGIVNDDSTVPNEHAKSVLQPNPRILVFGQFTHSKKEIARMFDNAFAKQGVELNNHSMLISIDRDYNKAKRGYSKLANPIQNREVDYFLYGPHPHSIRSRFGMDKWEEYFDQGDQLVQGDYNRMLSNSALQKSISTIVLDWMSKHNHK